MIPFLVVCDAFQSEMVAFADLVLPDTTYLERHDVMSMLDRPISRVRRPGGFGARARGGAAGPVQAVPGGADRTGLAPEVPRLHPRGGTRKFKDYPDFVVNFQPQPGVGFLMGWRGKDGTEHLRGEPNPKQWEMYAKNNCVFQYHMPEDQQYMRNWNQPTWTSPRTRAGASATTRCSWRCTPTRCSSFRLAAQGKTSAASRPSAARAHRHLLRPAAVLVRAAGEACTDLDAYPLNAITQRPMAMYHSWDSQNAWLRQIHSHNYLHVNPKTAQAAGIEDGGWCWVESRWGRGALHAALQRGGGARHGLDLERHRQGQRRLAAGAGRRRVAQGLPAQPPDQRGAAFRRHGQRHHQQQRPHHRPGRLVRRARAHPPGGPTRPPRVSRSGGRAGAPGVRGAAQGVLTYFAGRKP
jgi:anaerobic selenocysteine-containing dehydrogenase